MKDRVCLVLCGCLLLAAGAAFGDDTVKPKPGQGSERRLDPDKLFDRLDKNKDGFIDKDEAPPRLKERFDQVDTNKDGKISKEEFKQAMTVLQKLGGAGRQRNPDALFDRLDKNKDGFIDKSEAPERMQKRFDQIDTDKDGKISREEFKRAMLQRAKNRKGGTSPAKPAAGTSTPDNKSSTSSPNNPAEGKTSTGPSFESLDKNADGRLTREEVKGTSLEAKFDEIDTNKDGKIDPKEYEAYLRKTAK